MGFYHKDKDIKDKYDFDTRNVLGVGGVAGSVVKAIAHDGRGDFAVKTLRRTRHFSEKEVEIFAQLNHPNVAKLVEVFDVRTHVFLVMEMLTGGELFDRIQNLGAYSEVDAAGACSQMCRALRYLHTRRFPIVHGDLKPENWVYAAPDSDVLKLIDFGMTIEWDKQSSASFFAIGFTREYASPEVINSRGCTEKSDIFSLGIIFYLILTGHPPFAHAASLATFNQFQLWTQPRFLRLSRDAQSLLRLMLNFNATLRPSAEDICKDAWLKNNAQHGAVAAPMLPEVVNGIRAARFQSACLKMLAWSLSATDAEELQKCFARHDTAEVGKLSLNEFRNVLKEVYSIPKEEAAHMFANIQQQEDSPGEICYTNFLAEVMRERVRLHQRSLESLWTSLADSTGTILVTSLQAILPKESDSDTRVAFVKDLDPSHTGEASFQSFQALIASLVTPLEADVAHQDKKRKYTELAVRLIDNELGNGEACISSAPQFGRNVVHRTQGAISSR